MVGVRKSKAKTGASEANECNDNMPTFGPIDGNGNGNGNGNMDVNADGIEAAPAKPVRAPRKPRQTKASKVAQAQAAAEAEAEAANETATAASVQQDGSGDGDITAVDVVEEQVASTVKRRGRKPRGGKIIENNEGQDEMNQELPNVIAHFKCSSRIMEKQFLESVASSSNPYEYANNEASGNGVDTFQFDSVGGALLNGDTNQVGATELGFEYQLGTGVAGGSIINNTIHSNADSGMSQENNYAATANGNSTRNTSHTANELVADDDTASKGDMTIIHRKLKDLELQFHKNDVNSKRSACFWCTCAFDTQAFYIPKSYDADSVKPYGCFCCLECALAYLEKEDIDSSCKFERRQMLFHMYRDVISNRTSVKPAPDPRYTLDKFYGNLTIQEWRKMLKSDRMLLIVDKPLTPELPELHTESSDRFMTSGGMTGAEVAQYGKFKIRKTVPKQSKGDIVAQKFGVTK